MKMKAERVKEYFTETKPETFRAMMREDLGEEADEVWTKIVAEYMVKGNSIEESARLTMEQSRQALLESLTSNRPIVIAVELPEHMTKNQQYTPPTSKWVH